MNAPQTMTANALSVPADLDAHYPLHQAQIDAYQRDGMTKLSNVLSAETIARFRPAITTEVARRSKHQVPLEQRTTYGKAFLQCINLWLADADIHRFVIGQRIARMAAELMQCRGVRIYHDQALYKEAGGGHTPWHADQHYWPLSTDKSITAWIPLMPVTQEMGPLAFCPGSQRIAAMRKTADLDISDESEALIGRTLKDYPQFEEPFALGDVSFHAGWTFHRAGANTTPITREVMTIIFIDADMVIGEPKNQAQWGDLGSWFPGKKPGDLADSPINPVVWAQ